jgi:hypothetical protein
MRRERRNEGKNSFRRSLEVLVSDPQDASRICSSKVLTPLSHRSPSLPTWHRVSFRTTVAPLGFITDFLRLLIASKSTCTKRVRLRRSITSYPPPRSSLSPRTRYNLAAFSSPIRGFFSFKTSVVSSTRNRPSSVTPHGTISESSI